MRGIGLSALATTGMLMSLPAYSQQERLRFVTLLSDAAPAGMPSALSADGHLFAMGTPTGKVEIWDAAKGSHLETIAPPPNPVRAIAFTPDARLAYSSGARIDIVDLRTHSSGVVPGDWKDVSSFAISGNSIAWTTSQSKQVQVRPLSGGPVLRSFAKHSSAVLGMSFSPDGLRIATGEFYRVARMWSMRTSCVQQNFPNRSSGLHGINFSPDGRWLAVTSDSSVQISDTVSGQEVKRFLPDSGAFVAAAFSTDGSLTAVTDDAGLRLWRSRPLPFLTSIPKPRPSLHILVVGINSYLNQRWHLGFAQQDASDIAAFFEQHSAMLAWEPRSVRVLGDSATKDEIRSVLDQISKDARPEDALLVYFAGHGKQEGNDFFYFPFEMPVAPPERLTQWGLSASDLGAALQKIQARRQIMILDTCQSGAAIAAIKQAILRSAPVSRSLYILSASASTEEAMEIQELGHGVLTSALLSQLEKVVKGTRSTTVAALLASVAQTVPGLAATYNKSGSQKPDLTSIGTDFPLFQPGASQRTARGDSSTTTSDHARSVGEQASSSPAFSCRPTAADKAFVRPDGITETIGDIVFRCIGESASTSAKIQVYFNSNFTSKLLSDGSMEAILILEPPGTRTPDEQRHLGENAFRGRLVGPNVIQWPSIPLPSDSGTGGIDTQVRITGVRVNANQLGVSSTLALTEILTFYSVEIPSQEPLKQQQAVAYISGSLAAAFGGCSGSAVAVSGFESTSSQNASLLSGVSEQGVIQIGLRLQEPFPDYFLPARNRLKQREVLGTQAPVESLDQGTRFVMRIDNIGKGVAIYATRTANRFASSPLARAQLVDADPTGSGPFQPSARSGVGLCGENSLGMTQLAVHGSTATAVWEVTSSDPLGIDTFSFGLMIAFESKPEQGLPSLGTTTASVSYAPVSSISTASRTAPIPRFGFVGMSRTLFDIRPPITRLVFKEVANQAGFDSGVSITNTSSGSGSCTLMYGGSTVGGGPAPTPQTSQWLAPDAKLTLTLSAGGSHGITATPGFRGCVVAVCRLATAEGSYASWPMGSPPKELRKAIVLSPSMDVKDVSPGCDPVPGGRR